MKSITSNWLLVFCVKKLFLILGLFLAVTGPHVFAYNNCSDFENKQDCIVNSVDIGSGGNSIEGTETGYEGMSECYWDEENDKCIVNKYLECYGIMFSPRCMVKPQCGWRNGKCMPNSAQSQAQAVSKWKEQDCDGGYLDYPSKSVSELTPSGYTINGEPQPEGLAKTIDNACKDIINGGDTVCRYSEWLNDAGKRKCRRYYELMETANTELCIEQAEANWERSLKDSKARVFKEKQIAECKRVVYGDYYKGPVFSGVGLRGGAQLAKMSLSNSISKQRDIRGLIIDWSKFIVEIALVLAVVAIIWAGIRFITDMGDGAGVEAAKKIILWVVVGIILMLGSYAIVNTVMKAGRGTSREIISASQIIFNKIII